MERSTIALELFDYIRGEKFVDQGGANICGIAALTSGLIAGNKTLFVRIAIELAETGKSSLLPKLSVHPGSRAEDSDVMSAFLESIRHSYNVLGYSSKMPDWLESHLGATRPSTITALLETWGFTITFEATLLKDFYGSKVLPIHQLLLGGLYSDKHHQSFSSKKEHLKELADHIKRQGGIIMLVSHLPNNPELEEAPNDTVYGIELTHYIYVSDFSLISDNTISIQYETYGESVPASWTLDQFWELYRGEICFYNPETYELQAADQDEIVSQSFKEAQETTHVDLSAEFDKSPASSDETFEKGASCDGSYDERLEPLRETISLVPLNTDKLEKEPSSGKISPSALGSINKQSSAAINQYRFFSIAPASDQKGKSVPLKEGVLTLLNAPSYKSY